MNLSNHTIHESFKPYNVHESFKPYNVHESFKPYNVHESFKPYKPYSRKQTTGLPAALCSTFALWFWDGKQLLHGLVNYLITALEIAVVSMRMGRLSWISMCNWWEKLEFGKLSVCWRQVQREAESVIKRIAAAMQVKVKLKTNSMEQRPSWEADSSSASQEIARILWKPKVHYRIHNSPPPLPNLSLIDTAHAPHPTFRRPILIFSSHLCLDLPTCLFPSGFLTKTLCAPLLSPMRTTCPAYLNLDLIARTIFYKGKLDNCRKREREEVAVPLRAVIRKNCQTFTVKEMT